MSQTNATTGVASSGNIVGFSRGRKTTGEQVLGKEEKLRELVYKFNTKDQADMYLCTTEAIADFVGVEYGRDMRMLVKHGKEKIFICLIGPQIQKLLANRVQIIDQLETEFLRVQEQNSIKNPTTNLASIEEIKEETNFFRIILHCYDCAFGFLRRTRKIFTSEEISELRGAIDRLKTLWPTQRS
jgi:hypothetical protein